MLAHLLCGYALATFLSFMSIAWLVYLPPVSQIPIFDDWGLLGFKTFDDYGLRFGSFEKVAHMAPAPTPPSHYA
jgi:hypothetical protein